MKANELRIGNYYNSRGTFKKAAPSTIEELFESENRIWIQPIPITEEILLKCKGIRKAEIRPPYDSENKDENYDEEYYSEPYDLIGVGLCGFNAFKCELKNDCYQWIGLKDGKLYFLEDTIAADESVYLSKTSVGLSFLHEFQNAFQFFTGEELEINL